MPTQGAGNLAYDSTPVALAQAADGTLFAGLRDDSGNYRWPVMQGNRLYAVFTSSDGYTWAEGYKVPWDDNITTGTGNDPIVAIAPVPDYSKNNTVVYMATEKFVYVSANAGKTFTRLDSVPGVDYADAVITSMDVASTSAGYVVVVGTEGGAYGSGVFTYNEGGLGLWKDKQIGNDIYTANEYDVYAVKFSPSYATDKVILAVANTGSANLLTVRGTLGEWGVETLDATITVSVTAAKIVLPADFNIISNPVSYVKTASAVYKIVSVQSPGTVSPKSIGPSGVTFYDIAVTGSGSTAQAMVATNASNGGIQVYSCTNPGGFAPAWVPSYKQPSGGSNAMLATGTLGTFVATWGGPGLISGVSKMVIGAQGTAWNGVGLLDTEVATANYFDNDYIGGPVWTVASPNYKVDNTIFMVTTAVTRVNIDFAARPVMVWRTSNGGTTWDMIAMDNLGMGDANAETMTSEIIGDMFNLDTTVADFMTIQTVPAFSNNASGDQTMYMMAYNTVKSADWIFKSTDAGNTWKPIIAMPNFGGDDPSLTSWCVVNDSTLILSDQDGYVYVTANSGYSWTDGTETVYGDITSLKYYNDPTLGLVILAGVVSSESPYNAAVYISTNGGVTFSQVGTSLKAGADSMVQVDFDNNWNTNHIIYAAFGGYFDVWNVTAGSTGNMALKIDQYDAGIWRTPVMVGDPTSSLWTVIVSTSDFSAMLPAINSTSAMDTYARFLYPTALEVGPQNTLYVTLGCYDAAQGAITWGGFIRCLDGTASSTTKWAFVSSSLPGLGGLWTACVVPGSSNLFTIGARYNDDSGLLDLRLLNYDDTLASQAGNMVPASGAQGAGTISGGKVNVPLTWGGISGTSYEWQVALDSTFDNPVSSGTASAATATATGLEPGTTYYWRVRATQPSTGPWSGTVSFTTASTVSGAPQLISPANGASISDTKPIFTWSAVTGATSYKIQVATDSGFTSIVSDTTATTNVYASGKLSNNVYYWRVQATVGSTTTAWSATGAFTLGASTTSSTPAWVWVLIVLGIVLAIFVLVLILRTRRPV